MSALAIAWLVLVAGGGLLYVALRQLDRKRPKAAGSHLDEFHHGYVGGFVALGILIALTVPRLLAVVIAVAAFLLLIEDGISHLIQSYKREGWRGLFWHIWRSILTRFS